jgi:hypothetical protein
VSLEVITDGDLRALTIAVDPQKIAKMAGPDAGQKVKQVTDILGTRLETALVFGDDGVGMAMGPNGIKAAKAAANGSTGGGSQLAKRMSKQSAGITFGLDLAKALSAFRPILKQAGTQDVPNFEAGTNVSFSFSGGDNRLSVSMSCTLDQMVKAVMAASKADDR